MKVDNSPDDDDLVFRLILDSEERSDVSGPSSTKDLSQAAVQRLACLKLALESIRIASSGDATPIENLDELSCVENHNASSRFDLSLSSRFEFIRRLGAGGFGVVILALDKQLQCNVALKVPRPDVLLTKTLVKRFLREAQNVARLSHPNIVPLLGTDDSSDTPTIVYYYCEGPTLAQWIVGQSKPITAHIAARIGVLLAEGVQHAHSRGILHRDLKPSNVLLEQSSAGDVLHGFRDGETVWIPRITDFGISKVLEETDGQTQAGTVMGTLEYMPPEQISGRTNDIGTHSDIYSLGVILYQLLAGEVPYSRSQASARGHQSLVGSSTPSIRKVRPDVPRDLDAILQKCMSAHEKDRYATAAELIPELKNFLTNRPILARPAGPFARLQKWMRRQPLAASLAAACTVMATVGLIALVVTDQKTRAMNDQLGFTNANLAKAVLDADHERDLARQSARELRLQNYCEDLSAADQALRSGDISRYDFLLRRQIALSPSDDLRDSAWNYLWQKGHRSSKVVHRGKTPLYCVRFSPDGTRVAVSGADGIVRVFESSQWKEVHAWDALQSEVNGVDFSSDGQLIATAGDDGSIAVWDEASGNRLSRFHAHKGHAFQALFMDSKTLVTCGEEPTIKIWNWPEGLLVGKLEGHTETVQSLALNRELGQLYSGGSDGKRKMWDLIGRQPMAEFVDHEARILRVIGTSKNIGYFGAVDGALGYESLESTSAPGVLPKRARSAIEAISLRGDEQQIAYGTREGVIDLLGLTNEGLPDSAATPPWYGHDGRVFDLAYSPDGKTLTSVGEDGVFRIWPQQEEPSRLSYTQPNMTRKGPFWGMQCESTSNELLIYGADRNVFGWNLVKNEHFAMAANNITISRLAVSRANNMVFTGDNEGNLRAWSQKGQELKMDWEFAWPTGPQIVSALVCSEGSREIAIASGEERSAICLIDSQSGIELRRLVPPDYLPGDFVHNLAYSASGDRLAIAINNRVLLWNRNEDQFVALEGHTDMVNDVCFDRSAGLLYSSSMDRTCRIWDIDKGTCISVLKHPNAGVGSVVCSPDGRSILTSDDSGHTYVWHSQARRLLFELNPEVGGVSLSRQWVGDWLIRRVDYQSLRVERFEPFKSPSLGNAVKHFDQ